MVQGDRHRGPFLITLAFKVAGTILKSNRNGQNVMRLEPTWVGCQCQKRILGE
jgi:hypothetical protein